MRPKKPFFIGDGNKNLGIVHAHYAPDFRTFIDEVFSARQPVNLTKAEFLALPKERRDVIKRTTFFTPSYFDTTEGRTVQRRRDNALGVCMVCLDIDNSEMAKMIAENPEFAGDVMPWSVVVYHTANSTESDPRVRVVVDADLPIERYKEAVTEIANRLGIDPQGLGAGGSYGSESFNPVLPQYAPVAFRGEEDNYSPVAFARLDTGKLTVEDLNNVVLGEPPSSAVAELAFLREPMQGVTLEDATEMLEHVDPDVSYPQWRDVAMALKHQFQQKHEDLERAALLFEEWSKKGRKYSGDKSVQTLWNSIESNPPNREPITMRTISKRASESGWNDSKFRTKTVAAIDKWFEKQEDKHKLLAGGIGMIANATGLSSSERQSIIESLRGKLKELGTNVSASCIRKDVRDLKARSKANSEKGRSYPPWTRGIVYVQSENQFYTQQGKRFGMTACDAAYGRFLTTENASVDEEDAGADGIVAQSKPVVSASSYLLNLVKCPVVLGTIYDPTCGDRIVEADGVRYLNTFTPLHPEPNYFTMDEAKELIERHLYGLFNEPRHAEILLDWMCYVVQNQGKKIRWAPLLQGAQGCGKTAIMEALAYAIGVGNTKRVDSETLKRGWNEWAKESVVIALEEVRVSGVNRHEIMNVLKPLISNDTVDIRRRNTDSESVRNRANYILFTNHHDALPLSADDRRYCILKSKYQSKTEIAKDMPPSYFRRLFDCIENNAGGVRAYLLSRKITDRFDPNGHAPMTGFEVMMHESCHSPITEFIIDLVHSEKDALIGKDFISIRRLRNYISQDFSIHADHNIVAHSLKTIGYSAVGRVRVNQPEYNDDDPSDNRHSIWYAGTNTRDLMDLQTAIQRVLNLHNNRDLL